MDLNAENGRWRRVGPGGGVVMKLIGANVLVYILQLVLIRTSFTDMLSLQPHLVATRGYVWQIISYMFLHDESNLLHIVLNMFIIWMFGRTLESIWGSGRFLRFYFACGIGGALLSFVFAYNTKILGASAAAYGILLAYGVLFPNQRLLLWFLVPIRARTLVIGLVIFEVLMGLSVQDGIAHFAHLGGMAAALIMLRKEYQLRRFRAYIAGLLSRIPLRISFDRDEDARGNAEKVDSILDKIAEKGYENLTETEKRILERYSDDSRDQ